MNLNAIEPSTSGGGDKIRVVDTRKIRATTGKPINPNRDLITGDYDKKRIENVVKAAIRYGEDPVTMVALGMAESGYKEDNVGQVLGGTEYGDEAGAMVRHYAEKARSGSKRLSEVEALTRYNGTGKVGGGYDGARGNTIKEMYGVPIPKGGLDMGKTKLYSKNVLDIRNNIIAKNKLIKGIIAKHKKDYNPFEGEFNSNIRRETPAEKLMSVSSGFSIVYKHGGRISGIIYKK